MSGILTDQLLTLSDELDTIDLYSWLSKTPDAPGFEALAGIKGFGMTDQTNRWFEGAGNGALYRSSRVLPRILEIPLWAAEEDREALNNLLSRLSRMLHPRDPRLPAVRLTFGLPGGQTWYLGVVRESGGDYVRGGTDSDNNTWFKSSLTLKAGNPYWTRSSAESFVVTEDDSGRGLLPWLAKLELSFSGAFGEFTVNNPGDVPAKPLWIMHGPFTKVIMINKAGRSLVWEGDINNATRLFIDVETSTVIDSTGLNRYNGLVDDPAPKFWNIDPGESKITVVLEGTSSETYALCQWWPQRWAVI